MSVPEEKVGDFAKALGLRVFQVSIQNRPRRICFPSIMVLMSCNTSRRVSEAYFDAAAKYPFGRADPQAP